MRYCKSMRRVSLHGWAIADNESAESVSTMIAEALTYRQRQQTQHLSTDFPTHHLVVLLERVLPNLQYVSLDPIHIVFKFEQAFGDRPSHG